MTTQLHDEIVDDIREILTFEYSYPAQPAFVVRFAGDGTLGATTAGINNKKVRSMAADFYIFPQGEDPIFVEVGDMTPKNKWDHIFYDGLRKVRILRVSFERSYVILNKQETPFEAHLMLTLRKLEKFR